ncbi:hypothetical protein KVV02_001506 [Mortierella alpina]|uniref:Endonuclease/exonuclease/phosphatase domain-containing protein n=1 Tax=Mortierella alpina TaxID=64518 RepID=A0A9P8AC64_MORAP|nr:hypothetical protein KVV02_001506 [Mortierella alpina]
MSRPNRRMLTLPSAEGVTQDAGGIRLRKKKDRFLFMTYNVRMSMHPPKEKKGKENLLLCVCASLKKSPIRFLFMLAHHYYQLLAQALVRRDMFPHASQKALRWKFRKQNLLQEFLAYGPDLACLQEVDFWDEVYLPALTKAGYETSYYKNEKKKHGCAIIWRKTRFEKVDQMTLEYDDIGQPTFTTGNIGLMVGLQPLQQKASENPDPNADMVLPEEDESENDKNEAAQDEETSIPGGILVATTHLFWRPDGSYERLRQASILLEKIDDWNKHLNFTVLLGGDFNTTPRDAAYRAMTRNPMPAHQIPNLQSWLEAEVNRVQEAEAIAAAEAAPSPEAADSQDPVEQLTARTEQLDIKSSANGNKTDADLPYRAPPTGIILPKAAASAEKSSSETTIADSTKFGDSEDPKIKNLAIMASSAAGEDAPVHAPLEAFTPAENLLAAVEAHARCISIYGQYEALTKDDPAEVNIEAAEANKEIESTATAAPVEHTHGEPTFTNFATWFKDTLDYVYLYDQPIPKAGARLVPLRLLEIPDKSFLGHGLPDENFSSDHLCLMVEFALLAR